MKTLTNFKTCIKSLKASLFDSTTPFQKQAKNMFHSLLPTFLDNTRHNLRRRCTINSYFEIAGEKLFLCYFATP